MGRLFYFASIKILSPHLLLSDEPNHCFTFPQGKITPQP